MPGSGTGVVIGAGRAGEHAAFGAGRLHGWRPRLARAGQGQHHHLARLLLLSCEEIADRLQVGLLPGGERVPVQHEQVPLAVGWGRWQGWGGGAVRRSWLGHGGLLSRTGAVQGGRLLHGPGCWRGTGVLVRGG